MSSGTLYVLCHNLMNTGGCAVKWRSTDLDRHWYWLLFTASPHCDNCLVRSVWMVGSFTIQAQRTVHSLSASPAQNSKARVQYAFGMVCRPFPRSRCCPLARSEGCWGKVGAGTRLTCRLERT